MLIAAAAVLTAGLVLPASAAADYGYTSARTSMRYVPSVEYQRITIIPYGQRAPCLPRAAAVILPHPAQREQAGPFGMKDEDGHCDGRARLDE